MKTLKLKVNKEWYDLLDNRTIECDYREVKPYYVSRIMRNHLIQKFECVEFQNGYHKSCRKMTMRCLGIRIAEVNKKNYFIIKLGEKL